MAFAAVSCPPICRGDSNLAVIATRDRGDLCDHFSPYLCSVFAGGREGPAAAEGFCQFVRDSVAAKGRLRLRLPPYLMANRQ